MEAKNVFDSVVIDSNESREAKTVLMLHLLIIVVPISDGDVSGAGLNS
ncbi:MAG: hypothetical protein K6C05_09875 [Anaerovibrio sp.]|nr:hypothetical protein [Anaerovibrio sp.]MCR5177141.1 hypothetical protein [Anaerovibrio sp.]